MDPLRAVKGEDKKIFWPKLESSQFPFYGQIALGNMTQYNIAAVWVSRDELFVAIEEHGAYPFSHFVHWGYAQQKLGLKFDGDAKNVSDWINTQLGLTQIGNEVYELQGEYQDKFVSGGES